MVMNQELCPFCFEENVYYDRDENFKAGLTKVTVDRA